MSTGADKTGLTLDDIRDRPTISVPEAAQVLGIGRDAAYAAAERGELPTLRLGRTIRVPVPRLLQLLGEQLEHAERPDPEPAPPALRSAS